MPFTATASSTATNTATPAPLTILSILPNLVQADTTLNVIIIGSGFQSGALVTFEGGLGLPQQIITTQVINSTTIIVTMTARNDGTSGIQVWDVRVTNPDNSTIVLPDAFKVIPES